MYRGAGLHHHHRRLIPGRRRHPLIFGTAALSLSLLASALPSSAFAPASASAARGSPGSNFAFARPLRARGGRSPDAAGEMSAAREERREGAAPAASPFSRIMRKVVVVGGTHGNEYTGVWCIKAIEKQREMFHGGKVDGGRGVNVFERYPSLDIHTLLANPVAYMENKRFVDVDLNREFSREKLARAPADGKTPGECDIGTMFGADGHADSAEAHASLPLESARAREIEALLGPKLVAASPSADPSRGDSSHADGGTDVVIDLHTTTANMGITLIVPEGDTLMAAAAAYVLRECGRRHGEDGTRCLVHSMPRREDRMNLSSCGRNGFTIEVGPVPQGVIRHDVVEKTETAMHALLEFLHLRNLELREDPPSSRTLDRLDEIYPAGAVPCYRSAPALRPGELSGKIAWPNCPANPNFPQYMVHKSLQDRDFHPVRVGDPLFVTLDGTVIPYDGSHGEAVHLIFVNEGGYYYASSGTGIGVAVTSRFDWRTGLLVADDDDEDGGNEGAVAEGEDAYE